MVDEACVRPSNSVKDLAMVKSNIPKVIERIKPYLKVVNESPISQYDDTIDPHEILQVLSDPSGDYFNLVLSCFLLHMMAQDDGSTLILFSDFAPRLRDLMQCEWCEQEGEKLIPTMTDETTYINSPLSGQIFTLHNIYSLPTEMKKVYEIFFARYSMREMQSMDASRYLKTVLNLDAILSRGLIDFPDNFRREHGDLLESYFESFVSNYDECFVLDGDRFTFLSTVRHLPPHLCKMLQNERIFDFLPRLRASSNLMSNMFNSTSRAVERLLSEQSYSYFLDYAYWLVENSCTDPVNSFMQLMSVPLSNDGGPFSQNGDSYYKLVTGGDFYYADVDPIQAYSLVSDFFKFYDDCTGVPLTWQWELFMGERSGVKLDFHDELKF